jgi:hypothetical protein
MGILLFSEISGYLPLHSISQVQTLTGLKLKSEQNK